MDSIAESFVFFDEFEVYSCKLENFVKPCMLSLRVLLDTISAKNLDLAA